MPDQPKPKPLDDIFATEGYAAAKAEAERRGVIWFASAGATRKRKWPAKVRSTPRRA